MNQEIIKNAEIFAQSFFSKDATGHDWHHTDRVRRQAVSIAAEENAAIELCEVSALLHDVGDEKMHGDAKKGEEFLVAWLNKHVPDQDDSRKIQEVISTVSFKGGLNEQPQSLEAKVVQDADRLDAIGAVGIARCFMFAGSRGHSMHHPEKEYRHEMSLQEYRDGESSAIHHFYEKLLTLKDRMHTETGYKKALKRHERLEEFLDYFYQEWEENE